MNKIQDTELDIRSIVMSMIDNSSTGSQINLTADDCIIEVEITILSIQKGDKKEDYNKPRGDYAVAKNDPVADGVKAALST